ncbi:Spc24 subunit of Ndc80-domain-containing protein [Lentinula raphanica]|nr:Spc24 subunit of Ndc80-domain-containing protein [Lentinula raphanica]
MSIEISETIKVIQEMAAMMDPEDDYNTIVAAEERIKASRAQREKELEEAHANLKALSKTLEAAKQSAKRPKSVPSAESHAATVNELDNSKLSLVKSISDAENLLASQEAELAALKEEYQSLEHYDPAAEHEKDLDGTALRLKIYRGMGFDIAMNETNKMSTVLVRSQSGDVHPVPINDGQSHIEYTRQLWKLAAS